MLQFPPVDYNSRTPAYRQVAGWLIEAIRRGEYPPGTPLPSIMRLVQATGVARLTAAKALRAVGDAGYAELEPGMGWYVPERLPGERK